MKHLLPGRVLELRKSRSLLREGMERYLAFDLAGAEERFSRAAAMSRAAGRPAEVADADEHLYLVLRRRHRQEDAVGLLGELLASHQRLAGPSSDSSFAWRNELITTLGALSRFEEAEPLCRETLRLAERRYGESSLLAGYARVTLAWCLRRLGRWAEAAEVSRAALSDLEAAAGVDAPVTGWALVGLAKALQHQPQVTAAEEALVRAHANWDRVGMTGLANATLSHLVDLLLAGERFEEALSCSERRRRLSRGMPADVLPGRSRQLSELERHAFLLRVVGRVQQADRIDARAAVLRSLIEADPAAGDDTGEDPDGPLFDCEAVTDWPGAPTPVARAC